MGIKRAWWKIKSATKGLFRPPVGFPLGVHVPPDPADHAEDFAHRYAEQLDWLAAIQMEELGIPSERIGSSDHLHGLVSRRQDQPRLRVVQPGSDQQAIRQAGGEAVGEVASARPLG
jgi:hypothetical protein